MKKYIESKKITGAARELIKRIRYILNNEGFVMETTALGDNPETRSFVTMPGGFEIIFLAQAIVDMFKKFYEE